ncbi:Zinc finger BED domain-containing protein [Actinidia chinensis var. chinensis]|uniref:Zinc finger BED domain-containing protein n=1 Tax=Actinidia chinensis var. chinensis TaxID=1590841 RepID=A0A2R6PVS2_ACTCC|nr:Zinc finger BED domain-containing protein [Actinidia chinensis var. chinensis]
MTLNEDVVDECKALLALRKVFCSEKSPSKAVEDEPFKELVQMLDPELLVSIDRVGGKCLEIYGEEKAKVLRILRNFDGQISLSVDVLHSVKLGKCGSDYLCLTAYFIDDNWELKKWILNFTRVGGNQEDSPHELIIKCLKDWGIENKISTITMPNSSLYDETVEIVKDYIGGKKELQLNGRIFRVNCCSDTVSLMVRDANEEISYVLDKIGSIYSFEEPEPSWYNKNNQIKVALILESAGEFTYRYRGSWYDKPSKKEWKKVDSINRLVDDLYDIVFPLFEMGYSTGNIYLHHLQELRAYLIRESASGNKFLSDVLNKLLQRLGDYMKNTYLVLGIASVMDPRFKMKYLEFSCVKFEGNDGNSKVEMVSEAIHKLYSDYVKFESDCNNSLNLLREYNQFLISTSELKSELDLYLEEPVLGWTQDFNALSWWKFASSKYPTLSRMARYLLAIPISLATSDKAFYTEKREADQCIVSLRPDLVNAVMCIESWFPKHKKTPGNENASSNITIW